MRSADILIIGGGLAGLSLAAKLSQQKRDFLLLEARNRLGGRVLDQTCGNSAFDMGPAWFWPGQPRIANLITKFELASFEQHYAGDLLFEDERGFSERGRGFASMRGSYRLRGGLGSLIAALVSRTDFDRIVLGAAVRQIVKTDKGVAVETADLRKFSAKCIVLALPPRLAANFAFSPDLPAGAITAMEGIPTWMAGQAKALAVYYRAFWREAGLSGDVMSRIGPLAEIHDATPAGQELFALFGFVGVPASQRQDRTVLKAAILEQLERLFGEEATHPVAFHIKDWAQDPYTASTADAQPVFAHPHNGLPKALAGLWDGRLVFGGSEVAPQFAGYLEGALEAAEITIGKLEHIIV